MQSSVTSTTGPFEVVVLDNRDRKHTITLDDEGQIHDHETDAYASDPKERTPESNELVRQTRRFARYTLVEEEDELLAAPPAETPECLYTAFRLMDSLSDERFDELFCKLGRQLASHEHEDAYRPVPLPRTATDSDLLFYRVDLWMGQAEDADMDAYASYIDSIGQTELEESMTALLEDNPLTTGLNYFRNVGRIAAAGESDALDLLSINGRSNVRPVLVKPDGRVVEPAQGNPFDEPPTARLELPPMDPGTRDEFREYLAFHLLCRVRDSYLGMGLEPPQDLYKVLGHGSHEYTQRYRTLDMYDEYHNPAADVSAWDPRELAGGVE